LSLFPILGQIRYRQGEKSIALAMARNFFPFSFLLLKTGRRDFSQRPDVFRGFPEEPGFSFPANRCETELKYLALLRPLNHRADTNRRLPKKDVGLDHLRGEILHLVRVRLACYRKGEGNVFSAFGVKAHFQRQTLSHVLFLLLRYYASARVLIIDAVFHAAPITSSRAVMVVFNAASSAFDLIPLTVIVVFPSALLSNLNAIRVGCDTNIKFAIIQTS
jgi:hypothetical protein